MLRAAVLVIAGIAGASAQQATTPAADAARVQDVYAVYSAVMSNARVIGGNSNATFAFAAMTTPAQLEGALLPNASDSVRASIAKCNAPPPGYEDRWQEVLADFRSGSDAPVPLLRELKIAKPYIFLTESEISVFRSANNTMGGPPPLPNPQFGGAVAVISLSNVYFNKDRTLAAMRILSSCGVLCAEGARKIYEKVATGWREVTSGPRCFVVA